MKQLYAQQCFDVTSEQFGSFTFDRDQADKDGFFRATSPVFKDTANLFRWAHENAIDLAHYEAYNFPKQPRNE